jgi:hypothetical protein
MKNFLSKQLFKTLIVIGFTISTMCFAQAQNPLQGTWQNTQNGMRLELHPNFSYILNYSNGVLVQKGRYGVQNGYLLLQDTKTGQVVQSYWVLYYDKRFLILIDAVGNVLIFSHPQSQATSQFKGTQPAQQNGPQPKTDLSFVHPQSQATSQFEKTPPAQQNGPQIKTDHVEAYQNFTRFIIGQPLSKSEKAAIQNQAINESKANPTVLLKDIAGTQVMLQVSRLNNPIEIGFVRQALVAQLHKATRNLAEADKPALVKIINRHAPVLAFDEATNLALMQNDFESLLGYIQFVNKLLNRPFTITEQQKLQLKQALVSKFTTLPLEQKQALTVASLLYQVIEFNWKQFSPEQQQAYKQQLIAQNVVQPQTTAQQPQAATKQQPAKAQQPPATPKVNSNKPAVDTNEPAAVNAKIAKAQHEMELWKMINNISLRSYATILNIIKNIGGTGNYWKVR